MPHKKVFYTAAGYRFLYNPITEHFLELRNVLEVMMWIDTCVCLPLTILMVYCVCCVVRRSPVPVIYYTNLLTSNLIQFCIMIVWILRISSIIPAVIHLLCVMASLYFRMCIALERCFHITYPLLDCFRQTRSSVLVCVLVWAFCIVSVPLAIVLHELERLIIYAALPGPLFIFCLARTFRGLPAATSVPTEETRRSLGLLILLFFSYFLIVVPTIICDIYGHSSIVSSISFLLSPFVDLILFLFMWKGRIDKLLTCLCSSDVRPDHQCGLG